jgi:hypothetical protein
VTQLRWVVLGNQKYQNMKIIKSVKNKTWMGINSLVYVVPISVREYHLRLDQLIEVLYDELSQHSQINSNFIFHANQDSTIESVQSDKEKLYEAA